MNRINATITNERISCVVDGRFRSYTLVSEEGKALAQTIKREPQDIEEIRKIADLPAWIASHSFGRVVIDDRDRIRLDGNIVNYVAISALKRVMSEGFDPMPVIRFIENVAENPEEDIATDLFEFLQRGNLPFTDDGCFYAFKRVDVDFYDLHSHTVHYPVGGVVEMPRENCAKHRTGCGTGLHACYFDYLPAFHGGRGVILIVKINPKDVTDIPGGDGWDSAKLKCCRMEVVGTIPEEDAQAHFSSAVDRRPYKDDADIQNDATAEDGVTTSSADNPTDWAFVGYSAGQSDGLADGMSGFSYDLSGIEYPEDCIGEADRAQFSESYSVGYRDAFIGEAQSDDSDFDEDDDDFSQPFIEDDEEDETPTLEEAKAAGEADGRDQAFRDRGGVFDADPSDGADFWKFELASAEIESAYSQAYTKAYLENYETE